MFKKLIVTGATAALLLGSSVGVFASENHFFDPISSATINITNTGSVNNSVDTMANSGYNQILGGVVNTSGITTGAANAGSSVTTQLNWNQLNCGCSLGLSGFDKLHFSITNTGSVDNSVSTGANTGYNGISGNGGSLLWDEYTGGAVNNSSITTGAAGASSVVQSVVNTNMFGSTPL